MRFLVFPQCLAFLDAILRSPKFVKELAVPAFAEHLHRQQGLHWMYDARLVNEMQANNGDEKGNDILNKDGGMITTDMDEQLIHDKVGE